MVPYGHTNVFIAALLAASLLENPRGSLEVAVRPKVAQMKSVNIRLWQHSLDIGHRRRSGGVGISVAKDGF